MKPERFPECRSSIRAVLWPERFRGGCSFGGLRTRVRRRSPARPAKFPPTASSAWTLIAIRSTVNACRCGIRASIPS